MLIMSHENRKENKHRIVEKAYDASTLRFSQPNPLFGTRPPKSAVEEETREKERKKSKTSRERHRDSTK